MKEQEEYISRIVLELQPKSRRGYRRLFGIRENKFFNKEFFNNEQFTNQFLQQYDQIYLRQGQQIKCGKFLLSVKQIKREKYVKGSRTEVEYFLKGIPLNSNKQNDYSDEQGKSNESFLEDVIYKNGQANLDVEIEQVYSCYCSECKKSLKDGDFYIKTGNWNRPILCLNCFDLLFTFKCVRCAKSITFDQNTLISDGLATIRYVQFDDLYWHSDCCVCVTCLKPLINQKFYQDQLFNQLFCLEHIPNQYL